VALTAGAGQTGKSDRTAVAGMAFCATTNRTVVVRPSNGVALLATGGNCGMPLRQRERIRWTLGASGLELLAEGNLFSTQSLLAMHGGPTGCGVAAAKKLLIDTFVAGAAVAGGQVGADHKPVVIHLLLARAGLVTVQAIHTLLCMDRHFVFVNDRVLKPSMALGALARRANKVGGGLVGLNLGTSAIDQEGRKNESKRNNYSKEHRTK